MKPWTWRHAIIKSTLSSTTRHVLLTLSCHLNDLGEDCFPSTAMLAKETNLSERSVCTHLAIAAEQGWFAVRKHGYGKQKWARHEYFPRIPEGFDVPDRVEEGTEGGSVPKAKKGIGKALKEVQCPVDKGTETGSVPPQKALNVVPEGTEPDDVKALKEVQSSTAVNPSIKAAAHEQEIPAAAAAQKISKAENPEGELTGLLIELEQQRGKDLTIDRTRDRVHVLTWLGKGVRPEHLRLAHAAAVVARKRDTDDRPTYVGFISTFIDDAMAPRAAAVTTAASDGLPWYESTPEVIDAKGAELGVRPRKPDEAIASYRVLVVNASKEKSAVDFVLRDAKKFNDQRLYEFAVATFGDALMPTDFYA